MSNLKIQFGRRLRVLRKRADLTQEDLAENTGLTIESISNIERGIFRAKFDNIGKITKIINIEVKKLFHFNSRVNNKL